MSGPTIVSLCSGKKSLPAKPCEWCGRSWVPSKHTARTCSPTCRARLREAEKPSAGRPSRTYPPDVVERVQRLYESGATVSEIGEALGPGYRAQTIVERFVPVRRRTGKHDQSGERNDNWKGADAGLSAMHLRVQTLRGTPSYCALCDTTDPGAKYEWANLSGHYEDVHDYARLCVPCHRRLDSRRRAELGHPTTPARWARDAC